MHCLGSTLIRRAWWPLRFAFGAAHTWAPVALSSGDAMVIAAFANPEPVSATPSYAVVTLSADGSVMWSQPTESIPINDLVPGSLDSDRSYRISFTNGERRATSFCAREGFRARRVLPCGTQPYDPGAGRQPAGIAVSDWNGDGVSDVLQQGNATIAINGSNGTELVRGGPVDNYFLPTLFDVDGNGTDEVTLHGGYSPARTISHNLSTVVWAGTDDDRPYPYGAVASCTGGSVLVEGSLRTPRGSRQLVSPDRRSGLPARGFWPEGESSPTRPLLGPLRSGLDNSLRLPFTTT